jgi:hypothetical protein
MVSVTPGTGGVTLMSVFNALGALAAPRSTTQPFQVL